jgi:gluconokinase
MTVKPNAHITILPATEKDARAISALIRKNADAVLSADYSPEQLAAWKRHNSPARIRQGMAERTTFCAFRAGRLCGTIALQGSELVGFYVSAHLRGKGIGRLLLAHLEAYAATQGITALRLTSSPSATCFYLQNGWYSERTVVLSILGVDFEETLMTKTLTPLESRDMMSTQRVPRSAYDRTGGLVYFARMLDKIRLHTAGQLRSDFHQNLGGGFDGRCVRFLGVPYEAIRERVLSGGTDDEILKWCLEHGRRPTEEEILIWNKFMIKRGWRDEDDGSTQERVRSFLKQSPCCWFRRRG